MNRSFSPWIEAKDVSWETYRLYRQDSEQGWPELLDRQRVVILAEAGSGKTTEMKAQLRRLHQQDRDAFYVSVQDLGRHGLEASLSDREHQAFGSWLQSDKTAWFLVDSVDEGKVENVDLRSASRNLARAIAGAERRTRIILSSRYTDWDTKRDLETFEEWLPSQLNALPPAPTADDLLGQILRNEKIAPKPRKPETAVFLMSELDDTRVRRYAAGKDAEGIDSFIAAIEESNLWRFARRPLDLEWMVDYWRSNRKLGTLAEMLEASLSARLKESNPNHQLTDPLTPEQCRKALERVGAALVFGRAETVLIPSAEVSLDAHPGAIDLAAVLPDWSTPDVRRLLRRAAFDPSTFDRSRLHNDNQGEVRAFLAARWLARLGNAPSGDTKSIHDLLFATVYENDVIRPGTEAVAAWLALRDEKVAKLIVERDQTLLMNQGDPGSLSIQTRISVLDAWIGRLDVGHENRIIFDHDKLRRFVTPAMAPHLQELWTTHRDKSAARELIVMMVWLGRLSACLNIALESALKTDEAVVEGVFASRAVAAMGDEAAKLAVAKHVRSNRRALRPAVVWENIESLFPAYLTVTDLFAVVDEVGDTAYDAWAACLQRDWSLKKICGTSMGVC